MNDLEYNLQYCLEYNPQFFLKEDIASVLAYNEGEKDADPWHWLLLLKNGQVVYLTGWCDYTGWDCQSDAESKLVVKDVTWTEGNVLTARQKIAEELKLDNPPETNRFGQGDGAPGTSGYNPFSVGG